MLRKIRDHADTVVGWNKGLSWSRLKAEEGVPQEYDSFQKCAQEIALKEGGYSIEVDFLYWDEEVDVGL